MFVLPVDIASRIQVFNADTGSYVRTIGHGEGSSHGYLCRPISICLHPTSYKDGGMLVIVSEHGNDRVQVFID